MGQLRQVVEQMRRTLSTLTLTQKLLISSLVVIVAMAMFVVSQYAGARQMVELAPGLDSEQQQGAIEFLQVSGIEHRVSDGRLLVPLDRKYAVLGQMQQRGALPSDTSLMFDTVIGEIDWTMSSAQQRQLYLIAKQNELARVIAGMRGIREAKVLIDAPPTTGLGQSVRPATASASVLTDGGGAINQQTVDAIAHLVAGAEAGLDVSRVRVIDMSTNRQHQARSDADTVATDYIEHQSVVERKNRERLLDFLSYIDGVIVAVSAQVDIRKTTSRTERILPAGDGTVTAPVSESVHEITQRDTARSGGPGVRPNTGMSLDEGRSRQPTHQETQTDSQLTTVFGSEVMNVDDPRGMPTKINASINIPRSYFVSRYRQSTGQSGGNDISDADLQPVIDAETDRIRRGVEPLIETREDDQVVPGVVVVSMIPDAPLIEPQRAGGFFSGVTAQGSGGGIELSGAAKTIMMGMLALFALALMGLTLRKASRRQELPTPEELVGLPPALQMDSDVVGEADEADAALTGIELTDADIQRSKMLEQVASLVKDDPREAAGIVSKWIADAQ